MLAGHGQGGGRRGEQGFPGVGGVAFRFRQLRQGQGAGLADQAQGVSQQHDPGPGCQGRRAVVGQQLGVHPHQDLAAAQIGGQGLFLVRYPAMFEEVPGAVSALGVEGQAGQGFRRQ